ncbi:CstA-like transporter-associated (seleno)protein [Sphingosinicella sp.]|uniref:YbdD/YjiX family protein n=1 Tax=Sphingosinicella sp. TaxID=1917971 RepID=UPI0017ACC1F8|nr:CstA-like transporter-associated (seleno)protein [Sphingosinicella sp.]MBA4758967.1 YbdD/YjiX family protein [Sphingosinicella sp.]
MRGFLARLRETAHLMVGLPSYAAYLRHMAERHPERTPMSEPEFFRDRQEARYGGKNGGRCC